jgi:hypothetical protein
VDFGRYLVFARQSKNANLSPLNFVQEFSLRNSRVVMRRKIPFAFRKIGAPSETIISDRFSHRFGVGHFSKPLAF